MRPRDTSSVTRPARGFVRGRRVLPSLVGALTLVLAGSLSVAPTASASVGATVTRAGGTSRTQLMAGPTLNTTQHGWVASGARVELICFERGQNVRGPYGWSSIWYHVANGWLADVDLETGSNDPVTPACPTPKPSTSTQPSTDFRLPFPAGTQHTVTQSPADHANGIHPTWNYTAVDFAGTTQDVIVASNAGRVVFADSKLGTVLIDHGKDFCIQYLHMNTVAVSKGQTVRRGQRIGMMGSRGISTGVHLHWAGVKCSTRTRDGLAKPSSVVNTAEMGTNYPQWALAVSRNG